MKRKDKLHYFSVAEKVLFPITSQATRRGSISLPFCIPNRKSEVDAIPNTRQYYDRYFMTNAIAPNAVFGHNPLHVLACESPMIYFQSSISPEARNVTCRAVSFINHHRVLATTLSQIPFSCFPISSYPSFSIHRYRFSLAWD